MRLRIFLLILASLLFFHSNGRTQGREYNRRLLYVAAPGIRDYLEYGGHGILIFDINQAHQFVRRFPTGGLDENGKPLNVKGICASARTGRLYVSTTRTLMCFDLTSDKQLWETPYEGGCDRMAISPDGDVIYLPSLEGPHWHVVNALTGDIIRKIVPNSGAHNTIIGPEGKFAYLAGLKSPILRVANIRKHQVVKEIGPFGNFVRPFTVNGDESLCYVNVNGLLGFEIGDLRSGKVLHRVEITGFEKGPVKRHGCPSHGIALTPDEKEIWVADSANKRVHIFSNTFLPPKQKDSILLRDEPGWITFSIDGHFAYPSTGDVIETSTRKIVAELTDEKGNGVQSEKLLEIDFAGYRPVRAGNQFGLGGRE
jgi:NHL repeat-containing protein